MWHCLCNATRPGCTCRSISVNRQTFYRRFSMKAILSVPVGALALAVAFHAVGATLPQARTEHGVTYISGGIGHDESAAMKAEAKSYPLSMVFSAGKDNEYLADVRIAIKDKAGKEVLNAVSNGPIMLVKVPAGRYAIAAERNGKTWHRAVQVNQKGDKEVNFHCPSA